MPETFEELTVRALDDLWVGALFLTAGRESVAEDLLLNALKNAFHRFQAERPEVPGERWLEGRLASEYLAEAGRYQDTSEPPVNRFHGDLAEIDPQARAALWLTILRRWPYDGVAELVGEDRDGLRTLLRSRKLLWRAMEARRGDVSGEARG